MDGWMDGWMMMDGRMDGRMDRRIDDDGWIDIMWIFVYLMHVACLAPMDIYKLRCN